MAGDIRSSEQHLHIRLPEICWFCFHRCKRMLRENTLLKYEFWEQALVWIIALVCCLRHLFQRAVWAVWSPPFHPLWTAGYPASLCVLSGAKRRLIWLEFTVQCKITNEKAFCIPAQLLSPYLSQNSFFFLLSVRTGSSIQSLKPPTPCIYL